MTNAIPAAGIPAATTVSALAGDRGRRLGRPVRRSHARARAPRDSRAGNGRDRAAAAVLPALEPGTRATDLPRARAARRQRAGRPQRPGRVAQPRRARPGGAAQARQGEGQRHAPDFGGDHRADRRAGAGRPRRRPRLDHGHRPGERARRAVAPRSRAGCRSASRIRRSGRITSTSGARSPARSGSRTIARTTCRGGCSPTPTSSTPRTCAAGGSARTAGCRSPASSSAPSARWSGRSACSSCRRSGRATGGS